jgi:hypothetical protein
MSINWRTSGDTDLASWTASFPANSDIIKRGEQVATYNAARPYTRLCRGMLEAESSGATHYNAVPASMHNPLNMRIRGKEPFQQFDSIADCVAEWKARLTSTTYAYKDTQTVADLVGHYAPSSDNNNEQQYVDTVERVIDSLPPLFSSPGGLDTVGQKTAAIMRTIPGPMVDLDLHYEGASAQGVFAIVPDESGLVTAIAGGAPGDDTWANNPLDVELARAISTEISKATGLRLRATTEAGVMSERSTGVGIQGYRLATMAYSAAFRDRTVRLVVEHGSLPTADRDIILPTTFTEKCAKAAVIAVNRVYKVSPVQPPKPEPSPYATPGWTPVQDGKDHTDSKGTLWRAVNRVVHVKAGTEFYAQASMKAKKTRSAAGPQGMDVRIAWRVNSWYVTPVGSRFKIADADAVVSVKDAA